MGESTQKKGKKERKTDRETNGRTYDEQRVIRIAHLNL